MIVGPTLLFIAACLLAYSNGANDNFKGVATLFGSDVTSYRISLTLATVATFLGSMTSIFLAQGLIATFTGRTLAPIASTTTSEFGLAVTFAAGITVIFATVAGFPISTTHALTGALLDIGLFAGPINTIVLWNSFFLPLLLTPIIAAIIAAVAYLTARKSKVNEEAQRFGLNNLRFRDTLHGFSACVVSFARGLNDTRKIVALVFIGTAFGIQLTTVAVGVAMAVGGVLNARRVAVTMSRRITTLKPDQGLIANFVTSAIVLLASQAGLPASTTRVSVGSIFGTGMSRKRVNSRVISEIFMAWMLTIPVAAITSAGISWIFNVVRG